MAPRIALACGLTRALTQGLGAVPARALAMLSADVLGRTIAFPWRIPAGVMAAIVSAPILALAMGRRAGTGV